MTGDKMVLWLLRNSLFDISMMNLKVYGDWSVIARRCYTSVLRVYFVAMMSVWSALVE